MELSPEDPEIDANEDVIEAKELLAKRKKVKVEDISIEVLFKEFPFYYSFTEKMIIPHLKHLEECNRNGSTPKQHNFLDIAMYLPDESISA